MYNLCCLRTIYAKYSNSTPKLNNFYNSNQAHKYSVIGKDWEHSFIEPRNVVERVWFDIKNIYQYL
jgi:hypothetical protein